MRGFLLPRQGGLRVPDLCDPGRVSQWGRFCCGRIHSWRTTCIGILRLYCSPCEEKIDASQDHRLCAKRFWSPPDPPSSLSPTLSSFILGTPSADLRWTWWSEADPGDQVSQHLPDPGLHHSGRV